MLICVTVLAQPVHNLILNEPKDIPENPTSATAGGGGKGHNSQPVQLSGIDKVADVRRFDQHMYD